MLYPNPAMRDKKICEMSLLKKQKYFLIF